MNKNIIQRFASGFKSGFASTTSKSIMHDSYRGGKDIKFLFDGGNLCCSEFFQFDGLSKCIEAYTKCPPVHSIINKQVLAITNGKTWVLSKKDNKEVTADSGSKVKELLKKPNPLQSWKQFQSNFNTHIRLFGYCVIIPMKIVGAPMHTAESLWIVNPTNVEFVFAENKNQYYKSFENKILGINIINGNEKDFYKITDIIMLKDTSVSFDNNLIPESPIKPIEQPVNNLIGIYESQGTLIHARGSLGVLGPKNDPNGAISMTEDEKVELQESYNAKYGLKSAQWKIILSNTEMNWQSMMMPYGDLQLPEWGKDQLMSISDSLNYPFELLANGRAGSIGGTEADAFQKQLYQNFVIPFAEMIFEQLTNAFNGDRYGFYINIDYSHVNCLQEDLRKKSLERKAKNEYNKQEWDAGIRTLDDWRIDLGEDPLPDGKGKVYSTDLKNSSLPLAIQLGVGGTESFIQVLNSDLSNDQKRNALVLLFGLSEFDANNLTK